jgi:hypothetical protein
MGEGGHPSPAPVTTTVAFAPFLYFNELFTMSVFPFCSFNEKKEEFTVFLF